MIEGITDALIIERDKFLIGDVEAPAVAAAEIDSLLRPWLEAKA